MSSIIICGITSIEAYPKGISVKYCKQCVEKIELCIPSVKPDIEEPNEIHINICVEKVKMIETVLGPKLVIEGRIRVKIIYTADNRVQSVHSAHWEKTFCEYILFRDVKSSSCSLIVSSVFAGVEDVCVTCVGRRELSLSVIFILCPKVCENKNSIETYECYCNKGVNLNKLEISDALMHGDIKLLEYTNNTYDYIVKKEDKYEYENKNEGYNEQEGDNKNKYYRQRGKNDKYSLYKRDRERNGY